MHTSPAITLPPHLQRRQASSQQPRGAAQLLSGGGQAQGARPGTLLQGGRGAVDALHCQELLLLDESDQVRDDVKLALR